MGKSKHKLSNVSSAANPSSTSNSNSANTHSSAVLRSSFCPSRFQLSLFASVIRSLDAEHLRVHDTRTAQLRSDYSVDPSTSVTCLCWGLHGRGQTTSTKDKASKKRKRTVAADNGSQKDVVIAYGTRDSEVQFFSPNEAKIVGTLKDGHTGGIRDFKFLGDGSNGEGWSIGGDSRLIQWDLDTSHPVRSARFHHQSLSLMLKADVILEQSRCLQDWQTSYNLCLTRYSVHHTWHIASFRGVM